MLSGEESRYERRGLSLGSAAQPSLPVPQATREMVLSTPMRCRPLREVAVKSRAVRDDGNG
jgi:hypothetical protein